MVFIPDLDAPDAFLPGRLDRPHMPAARFPGRRGRGSPARAHSERLAERLGNARLAKVLLSFLGWRASPAPYPHRLIVALLLLALVIWWAEDRSFGDAVYLTLITGLTVGYGDISPVTLAGRTAKFLAALIGVIFTGIYVAIATNAVSHCVDEKNRSIAPLSSSKTAATPAGSRPEV